MSITTIDLSLKNTALYEGCNIEEVAGRLNLATPVEEAVNIVGRNIHSMLESVDSKDEVVLTGPAPIWVYLICFHAVVHVFTTVKYNNGKETVIVAKHG